VKGYGRFIFIFLTVFALYVIAEVNKPQPIDWSVTLSKGDKNPYGAYVLFNQLKDIFPQASIHSYRLPVYNQVNNYSGSNTAYILCNSEFDPSANDIDEMLKYVEQGNSVLLSASNLSKKILDTLHLKTEQSFSSLSNDSTYVRLTNPSLQSQKSYTFKRMTIDEYFSSFDTTKATVLGMNNRNKANYVKLPFGEGAIFVHANPLVFSNYFMLHQNNAAYTANVLSYLPADVSKIFWDEYYKLGPAGATTPLRFFLSNEYLLWALRLSLLGMLIYVFFEMKRRQRIIPIITPLKNTTVEFIKTVATVYFQQKDNSSIATKKITYFLEFIRNKYFIPTTTFDEQFIEQLSRKSGVQREDVKQLVDLIAEAHNPPQLSDKFLLFLNHKIDQFYKQVQ
jgi:hypothetical protein